MNLLLDDKANLIDAINEVDKIINSKERFPLPGYQSLLHMIYNPVKNMFYKQVAITAYKSGLMLNVREEPKKELPVETTVILIPWGGCITEWEGSLDYDEFLKAKSKTTVRITFIAH